MADGFCVLCATAKDIVIMRPGTVEAEVGEEFLLAQDGLAGAEDRLLLAMMADAGDESMLLQRFFDDSSLDIAEGPPEMSAFIERVAYLFKHGGAVNCGYTKFAMENMKNTCTYVFKRTSVCIGLKDGPPPDMIQKCLKHMSGWVTRAVAILRQECPDWESIGVSQVLTLNKHYSKTKSFRGCDWCCRSRG